MTKKILVFINYYGKTSETFISDEIDFLSEQKSLKLSVLHYGVSIPEKNVFGLSMPSTSYKRSLNLLKNFNLSILKSLRYKNGLNASLAALIPFFKENQFDTIYCHFGTNGKLIAQLKAINVIPEATKLVIRFHGLDMNFSKYSKGYYHILNRFCNVVLVGSKFGINNLKEYHLKNSIIRLLPVGVNANDIDKKSDSEEEILKTFKILSVGRLINLKGYLNAIDIIHKLKSDGISNFTYTIVGDGPLLKDIQKRIIDKGLQEHVILIKRLPHQEVLNLLKNSDIYLYSGIVDSEGRTETQGLANLEAMANGLVIVASTVGGIPDYVVNFKTGFLCESTEIAEFADQIKYILQNYNSEEIQEVKKNAIKIVKDNYCQKSLNKRLMEIL